MNSNIMILGAGNIGLATLQLLSANPNLNLTINCELSQYDELRSKLDSNIRLVTFNHGGWKILAKQNDILINAMPYFFNKQIVDWVYHNPIHYFDFSEDVFYTKDHDWSKFLKAFVPHCGLAPGVINMIGASLLKDASPNTHLRLKVGALPKKIPDNPFRYALTWSLDGLINEYLNPCTIISHQRPKVVHGLRDLENILIDGTLYESFNTSGGIGTMVETYTDKVEYLSYQTLRYQGHASAMLYLLDNLKLRTRQSLFKSILELNLPKTKEDVVIVYAKLSDNNGVKLYTRKIEGQYGLTAIQLATASGLVGVIEMMMKDGFPSGFVKQEEIDFNKYTETKNGVIYK